MGNLIVGNLHLTGSTAQIVKGTFTNSSSGKNVYRHAYGGFGVSLALAAFVGIISSFWVWIAAVMGVYWERKAGPAVVATMEKLSADISPS